MFKNRKGFTLIELLVVIAIIGILASIVLVSLNSARAKARDAKRQADLKQVAVALELYYNSNNAYPATASYTTAMTALSTGGYLTTKPVDPKTSSDYTWVDNSGSGNSEKYAVCADLESPLGNRFVVKSSGTANEVGACSAVAL